MWPLLLEGIHLRRLNSRSCWQTRSSVGTVVASLVYIYFSGKHEKSLLGTGQNSERDGFLCTEWEKCEALILFFGSFYAEVLTFLEGGCWLMGSPDRKKMSPTVDISLQSTLSLIGAHYLYINKLSLVPTRRQIFILSQALLLISYTMQSH